jgi:hypothetical protein
MPLPNFVNNVYLLSNIKRIVGYNKSITCTIIKTLCVNEIFPACAQHEDRRQFFSPCHHDKIVNADIVIIHSCLSKMIESDG